MTSFRHHDKSEPPYGNRDVAAAVAPRLVWYAPNADAVAALRVAGYETLSGSDKNLELCRDALVVIIPEERSAKSILVAAAAARKLREIAAEVRCSKYGWVEFRAGLGAGILPGKIAEAAADGVPWTEEQAKEDVRLALECDEVAIPNQELTAADERETAPFAGQLMSEIVRESVTWLWSNRIPFGKITILDGDPGDGKTMIGSDIAAKVSRGVNLPGDNTPREPAGAVIVTLEDGLADTICGRLEAAGADLTRIHAIQVVPDDKGDERMFTLPNDIPILENAVKAVNANFVLIDPLMATLGASINSHKDQDVRRMLQPLARFAERTGVAVLVIRHLNKLAGGNPLYRGGGSIGIIGTARCGLMVLPDPSEEGVRVLASTKSNLGPPPASLRYRIETSGSHPESPRIVWLGETSLSSNELLAIHDDPTQRDEGPREFLRELLATGPKEANDVYKAGQEHDYSKTILQRAAKSLGIVPKKKGFQGSWTWALPAKKTSQQQRPGQ